MFCMNCGQQLPDGAKYCLQCGTPQGAIKALTVRGNVQVGSATINVSSTNTDSLLQRVEIMLGDGDFREAMSKCDTILDSDPTNGRVYFYMLMSDLKCRNRNDLASLTRPFDGNYYYIKAMQYGDPELKNELQGYTDRTYAKYDANLKNPTVGAEIFFGHYWDGQSVIWKILRIQNNMLFIISSDIICKQPYHKPGGSITWADCTLRKWLNNDFIRGYFTPAEQARILSCKLNNDKNPQYNTPGGVPTTDKVFLLSINEANQLFANNQARGSSWWLRSPGDNPYYAAYVGLKGEVHAGGMQAYYGDPGLGVRPALWLRRRRENI